MTKTY